MAKSQWKLDAIRYLHQCLGGACRVSCQDLMRCQLSLQGRWCSASTMVRCPYTEKVDNLYLWVVLKCTDCLEEIPFLHRMWQRLQLRLWPELALQLQFDAFICTAAWFSAELIFHLRIWISLWLWRHMWDCCGSQLIAAGVRLIMKTSPWPDELCEKYLQPCQSTALWVRR